MCYSSWDDVDEDGVILYIQKPVKKRGRVKKQKYTNGFSYPERYIVKQEENQVIDSGNWGFLPNYINSEAKALEFRKKYTTLNAKSEEVFDKPLYKKSIMTKRCLIPTTAFFENRHVGKNTYPYYIAVKDQPLFCFAGIYNEWVNEDGEEKNSYSVLTTEALAGTLMAKIHNTKLRQPLILPKDAESIWLDPGLNENQVKDLMKVFNNDMLYAHPIAKLKKGVEVSIDEFSYPELALLDS